MSETATVQVMTETISNDEASLYDRQIRLWGINSQTRIRASNVLVVGMNSVNSEITKCLVLAGINSLTIVDSKLSTRDDLCGNIFLAGQVGKNRALACEPYIKQLNPNVKITSTEKTLDQFLETETDLTQYRCVVLSDASIKQAIQLNNICHAQSVPFVYLTTHRHLGLAFFDVCSLFKDNKYVTLQDALQNNTFDSNSLLKRRRDVPKVRKVLDFFLNLEESRNSDINDEQKKILEQKLQQTLDEGPILFAETSAASILGALIAQSIIRILTVEESYGNKNLFLMNMAEGDQVQTSVFGMTV